MIHTELDLKFRPRKFSEVVGNSAVVNLLLARSRNGTLSGRSMMFAGPKGCGKTSLARIVARAIACDNLDAQGEPCGKCVSCEAVSQETSNSTEEFDAATQGTVDKVRSILSDLEYGSLDGKPRVIILDEAQRLSKPAQDAILKAVEDRRFVVILSTTEPYKIGQALRSRVEEYSISPPSSDEIVRRMQFICEQESIKADKDALILTARSLDFCPRTCVVALNTLSLLGPITLITVKSHFRYNSMEMINKVLASCDSKTEEAFDTLDSLFMSEGPTWVRDQIVAAIASSMRQKVGAKPTYAVNTTFFDVRGSKWADVARALGSIEKPTASDIQSILLATSPKILGLPIPIPVISTTGFKYPMPDSVTIVHPPGIPLSDSVNTQTSNHQYLDQKPTDIHPSAPVVSPKASIVPPVPKPLEKIPDHSKATQALKLVPTEKVRSIEIDGVLFSSDEALTSLDNKIAHGSCGVPMPIEPTSPEVESDMSRAAIPEKEFIRSFKEYYRRT